MRFHCLIAPLRARPLSLRPLSLCFLIAVNSIFALLLQAGCTAIRTRPGDPRQNASNELLKACDMTLSSCIRFAEKEAANINSLDDERSLQKIRMQAMDMIWVCPEEARSSASYVLSRLREHRVNPARHSMGLGEPSDIANEAMREAMASQSVLDCLSFVGESKTSSGVEVLRSFYGITMEPENITENTDMDSERLTLKLRDLLHRIEDRELTGAVVFPREKSVRLIAVDESSRMASILPSLSSYDSYTIGEGESLSSFRGVGDGLYRGDLA